MGTASITRRALLAGIGAGALLATLHPVPGWAAAGDVFLTAYGTADSPPAFGIAAVRLDGTVLFSRRLPGRAHAVVVRPGGDEAVVFARRPGTWLVPLDAASGEIGRPVAAEAGRPFTGHGAFDAEGRLLFVGEDYSDREVGAIGVYDAADGYRRLGTLPTHGIGPHEILAVNGARVLVCGNGGVITHPDTGRAKLNLDTMDASLTYVEAASGRLLDIVRLPPTLANLGIRHLAALHDGGVAFGCQDERPTGESQPLVGVHTPGGKVRLFDAPEEVWDAFEGYIGAVAANGRTVAATSPRGGVVGIWEAATGRWLGNAPLPDTCGLTVSERGFAATNGFGAITELVPRGPIEAHGSTVPGHRWDNHLTRIGRG